MSEVPRFWSHEASNIRCVREADFDRVTAERDAQKEYADRADSVIAQLQQRLTAADERADLLEGLVGEVLDAVGREPLDLDAVLRLRARMRAALKPAECAADEHVCTGCGAKGWTANCKECVPY